MLADIAHAISFQVKDAAFALDECGLLSHVQITGNGAKGQIGITWEMVKAVAKER